MKNKKIIILLAAAFVSLMPLAAKSKKAVITERPERMMWQIKAPNGTEINILGTIHITDKETNNSLPPSVLELVEEADFIYGELSAKDLPRCLVEVQKLMLTDKPKDKNKKRIYAKDYLTEDEYQLMTEIVEKTLYEQTKNKNLSSYMIKSVLKLPPWSLSSIVQSSFYKDIGVSAENGIDYIIYNAAKLHNIEVQGLDKLEDQLKLLHYGTTEDQITILKANLEQYKNQSSETKELLKKMIQAYKDDDRAGLKEIIDEELENDLDCEGLSKDYIKKYSDAMLKNRNTKWAKQIKKMLKTKNKRYFIFTGAAHWVGQDSVFDILVKQGVAERQ